MDKLLLPAVELAPEITIPAMVVGGLGAGVVEIFD